MFFSSITENGANSKDKSGNLGGLITNFYNNGLKLLLYQLRLIYNPDKMK